MRILHILNHTFRLNGNVHAAVDLACAQAGQGHEIYMLSSGGSFDDLLKENGVRPVEFKAGRSPLKLLSSMRRLHRECKDIQPDVVHSHMMASSVIAWPVTRLLRIPLVTTVHNAFEFSAILMALGDRVIAVSRAVKDSMARRGIPRSRLRVVLNGTIGSARLPYPPPPPIALAHPAIVSVCGLHPRKGIADLIDAFGIVSALQPQARLYLVGEGPMRSDYEQLASKLGIESSVEFVGSVGDPRAYLKAADIFVLASRSDPAPLVLSEAREAGCAIVATNVDGIPELLDDGAAGILVEPRQPQAIANALLGLLANPEELQKYKARSIENLASFSVGRVAANTIDIYRECISERARPDISCAPAKAGK